MALTWPTARAQSYPARTIRYIVPVAAGGGSDLVGRTVTERWARLLNQSIVVDNIGGAGGQCRSRLAGIQIRQIFQRDRSIKVTVGAI